MSTHSPAASFDREVSWLSFNHRILQEARDPSNPLLERLRFLAIYSSNLDEFFRVRIAGLHALVAEGGGSAEAAGAAETLERVRRTVARQQRELGRIFTREILPGLRGQGIRVLAPRALALEQREAAARYFDSEIRPRVTPVLLGTGGEPPRLGNRRLYLLVELWPPAGPARPGEPPWAFGLVEVPSPPLPRLVTLPAPEGSQAVAMLEDVLRFGLGRLFPGWRAGRSYEVKVSRDAELYVSDEFSGDVRERIERSLARRETGAPVRLLHDARMPPLALDVLQERLGLGDAVLVPGGRYHNFSDFFDFPAPDRPDLWFSPLPALPHPELHAAGSLLQAVGERDRMLHLPYQSPAYLVRFLAEAAADPDVEEVMITLYRVAGDSAVVGALREAARRGKRVTAVVEVQARFDEAANLRHARELEEAGARVAHGPPGLKVHAKLALVSRREDGRLREYAYLGTGNFNEKTARVYADHGLFTADPRLTGEVRMVMEALAEGRVPDAAFRHLLVAPHGMRAGFHRLIDREIAHARAGRPAGMILKMNSLEDPEIVDRLYEASRAGVSVRLLVRGICVLVPGVPGLSENVRVTSLVGRFLEHARLYVFRNGGRPEYYAASADWMRRNLSRRVEVAFPILDPALRAELRCILRLQLRDTAKARVVDRRQRNRYVRPRPGDEPREAQREIHEMLARAAARAGAL